MSSLVYIIEMRGINRNIESGFRSAVITAVCFYRIAAALCLVNGGALIGTPGAEDSAAVMLPVSCDSGAASLFDTRKCQLCSTIGDDVPNVSNDIML